MEEEEKEKQKTKEGIEFSHGALKRGKFGGFLKRREIEEWEKEKRKITRETVKICVCKQNPLPRGFCSQALFTRFHVTLAK